MNDFGRIIVEIVPPGFPSGHQRQTYMIALSLDQWHDLTAPQPRELRSEMAQWEVIEFADRLHRAERYLEGWGYQIAQAINRAFGRT
jgi:hypothetical protein